MATANILCLPTELLQKTFDYLDWNRATSLTPSRPDIFNISLTCGQLRQAVLPILFRVVTLKLRWINHSLGEPSLLQLRRRCPHLAKYIRCVFIETLYGHFADPHFELRPFTAPEKVQDWLNPASSASDDDRDHIDHSKHQKRVHNVAKALFSSPEYLRLLSHCPHDLRVHAEELSRQLLGEDESVQSRTPDSIRPSNAISEAQQSPLGEDTYASSAREDAPLFISTLSAAAQRTQYKYLRLRLDALLIVALCLPPSLNSLVFEALPTDRMDVIQTSFALQVAAMALEIFGDRLQRLAVITCPYLRGSTSASDDVEHDRQSKMLSPEVIGNLQVVKTLALVSHTRLQDLTRWHTVSNTVTKLELCKLNAQPDELVKLITGFANLQHLRLNNIWLARAWNGNLQNRQPSTAVWLSLLIDLRRQMPMVTFGLEGMRLGAADFLSPSGLSWLLEQAVPAGCKLDFERETRLMEDFESFVPLWKAEDSVRGDAAREARRDGKLVDMAMSSRWRGLY